MTTIPVVDISPIYRGDAGAIETVGSAIDKAAREIGFFYIKGHQIGLEQIKTMQAYTKEFFAQDLAEKEKIAMTDTSPRGYGHAAREQLDANSPNDNKETWNFGYDYAKDDPEIKAGLPLRSLNQFPNIKGYREFFLGYYADVLQLARTILKSLTPHLGVESTHFDGIFERPLSVMRTIHYPATDDKTITAGAHTDYGCITLLYQDNIGGLQVLDSKGDWIDATPMEGAFVVNIGDMLARWSNDRYKSTKHRVLSTPNVERYSYPFFCEPDPNTLLECLPACKSEENPAKYPSCTAEEHLLNRFRETYPTFKA